MEVKIELTFKPEYKKEDVLEILRITGEYTPTSEVAKRMGCVQRTAKQLLQELEKEKLVVSEKQKWKGRDGFRWVWKMV